jgi:arylsulfatase A-like enzyme
MRRRWWLAIGLAAAVVALVGAWVSSGRSDRPAGASGPNVLVIVWDTVRADHLSLYGYRRPTTPRLDAFARDAVVFERASSPGMWTLPAHASMFTGLPPESHGADERWLWLDGHNLTMAEHFEANGYATFTMAANTLLCDETNLVQGFATKLNTYKGKVGKMAKAATREKLLPNDRSNELSPLWRPPAHGAKNAEWGRAVYKEGGPIVAEAMLEWIDRRKNRRKPFFAFLNLMEAHTPRIPTMASRERVLADDPELVALGLETDAAHINLHFYNFGKVTYSERQLDAIRGVYDASIADLDAATGRLFDGLAERGLLEDTIVVLTSDHGENLGDHHLFNHRFSLWDSLVHVPLVVRAPGQVARRVDRPVSTIDLFSTLARLAGLPVPDGIAAGDLLGGTSSPAVTSMALPLEREILSVKEVHPDVEVGPWMRSGNAVVRDGRKLVRLSDGTSALFDLRADPGETTPLDDPAGAAALGAELDAWLSSTPPYDPTRRTESPEHVRASQDELRQQLEAIGYATEDE